MTITELAPERPVAPVLVTPRRVPRPSRSGWITAAIAGFTAVLYTWNLSNIGYGNGYYAAAVKAMSVSWKAFFFGAIDPGSFITVDKPPAALWLQALAARVFGFSSWSMLLPQALLGVGSVLILHRLVRKWAGDPAAHLAALAFAITPVALLMFRYNNPDAMLTFLGLAAAWALWSALETGRTRMLLLAAALTGLSFQAKMMQAFLVLPAFVLVYLIAGKPKLGRRLLQLGAAAAALVASAGWWVAIVAMWPASSRPYIGSTSDNSIVSLIFGYNGLARLFGGQGPAGGAGPGGGAGGPGGNGNTGFGGVPGWLRMFNPANGGQISWLLPLAALALIAGLWVTRRSPRTDLHRAGWVLWGGWALVCYVVFSKAEGIFHPYYSIQLAPAVAALAGAGGVTLWKLGRRSNLLRLALPTAVVVTAAWAVGLLLRTSAFRSWLRPSIIAGAAIAAAGIWLAWRFRSRGLLAVSGGVAAVTLLAAPFAYSVTTIANGRTGAIVAAGPTDGGGVGGPDGGGGAGDGGAGLGRGATAANAGLVAYLEANQGVATYLVAAFGAQSSAPIIIASGKPVITIGGFNGGDPAPTLAQFQSLVASGKVRFILVGGGGPGGGAGRPGGGGQISQWAIENGTQVPASAYGGSTNGTLYDLSGSVTA